MKKILPKLSSIIDTIICVLLVIVTISKGGFYKEDILFPVLLINILGVVLAIIKIIMNIKNNGIICKSKFVTIMDIFMVLLPLAYALPILFKKSFSIENSMFEILRYVNVAIIYYILRSSKNTKLYINVILIIACIIGLFGIDEITYRLMEEINLPIGYLERNGSVISSVVQYANIAAILMLLGNAICIYKLEEKNSILYSYLLVFLQTQILLTSSRMGLGLLIIQLLIYILYYSFKDKISNTLTLVISFITSLICSGLISNLVESLNYISVIFVYIAMLILSFFLKNVGKIIKEIKTKYINKLNKNLIIYSTLCILALIVLCFILPSTLKVTDGSIITRKTTKFIYGNNELYLKIIPEAKETDFEVTIYQIYEDYKPEEVKKIHSSQFINNEYVGNFKTTKGSKFVEFVYESKQHDICVESVKINNKDITMSYLFLPDRLAFRIIDSFYLDLNNTLRLDYYKDAISLIKRSPFIGNGGEGFKLGYQMVQDNTYISSEVHSSPLQIFVEAGIIGFIAYFIVNIVGIVLCLKMYQKNKDIYIVTLIVILISVNIMSLFDLTLSFAITSYLLAVILGVIVNEYLNIEFKNNDKYYLDNKSIIAMGSIIFLCFSLVAVSGMIIYNSKLYKASLINVPIAVENTEQYSDKLFEKVVALENKVNLDKYNINYMIELDNTYSEYIDVLKRLSISVINEAERENVNKELAKYVIRQKTNLDNMIECEYYNKYAISQVATGYFSNYVRYADILSKQFENREIAYSFYLNYALKLTERLLTIGSKNKVANQMYENILNVYVENLSNQNKYIQSIAIESIIQEMKQNIADFEVL